MFLCISEKYEYVGRLLRAGEEPTSYSDEEEESPNESNNSNKSDITNVNATTGEKPKDEWPEYTENSVLTKRKNPLNNSMITATITNCNINNNDVKSENNIITLNCLNNSGKNMKKPDNGNIFGTNNQCLCDMFGYD